MKRTYPDSSTTHCTNWRISRSTGPQERVCRCSGWMCRAASAPKAKTAKQTTRTHGSLPRNVSNCQHENLTNTDKHSQEADPHERIVRNLSKENHPHCLWWSCDDLGTLSYLRLAADS